MKRNILKKSNYKKEFRLIDHQKENAKNDELVFSDDDAATLAHIYYSSNVEKEEIFSQEEDLDEVDERIYQLQSYIDKANEKVHNTLREVDQKITDLEYKKYEVSSNIMNVYRQER